MKQKMLIVTVVILSLVLALVIGVAVWMELGAAKQNGDPAETAGQSTPSSSVPDTDPTSITEPASTTPGTEPADTTAPVETTVPVVTEPDEDFTWPRDELEDITAPPTTATDPVETTQPTDPTTEPTSGNIGGAGGPNEGELDPIL